MAAPPLPNPPAGAGVVPQITLQAARTAVGNALKTFPTQTEFKDNGVTPRLRTALGVYIQNFEQIELQNDPTVILMLQCDIAEWGLRHWPISVSSDETRDLVIKYRFNWRKTGMPNSHPKARVARLITDRMLLIEAFAKAKELNTTSILDYYGSKRNLVLRDRIYSMLSLFSMRLVDLDWYRPLVTSKDRTDYTSLLRKYPSVLPPPGGFIAVMTDIYCRPQQIVKELNDVGCEYAVFATQIFPKNSLAGCHFDHMTYVNNNGIIHQAPGVRDHEWASTYVNEEWVTHRGYHFNAPVPTTWEWDNWSTVEDYQIYRLVPSPGLLPIEGPFASPVSLSSYIETRTITPKRWSSMLQYYLSSWFCRPTVFNKPLKVFTPAVTALAAKYVNKTRQTFQESNCQTEVANILDKKEYKEFWEGLRTNAQFDKESIARDTCTFIFWGGLEEDSVMRRRVAESLGNTWRDFKELKNHLPAAPDTWPWPLIILTAVGLTAGFYYMKTRSMASILERYIPEHAKIKMPPPKMEVKTPEVGPITAQGIYDLSEAPAGNVATVYLSQIWERARPKWLPAAQEVLDDWYYNGIPYKPVPQHYDRIMSIPNTLRQFVEKVKTLPTQVEEVQKVMVGTAIGSAILITAPIYEELGKSKWPIVKFIIAGLEGRGDPILTMVKYFWHKYVNTLPNNITAHHSWNTGCSLASLMIFGDGGLSVIVQYGWPLHLAAIISPHRLSNLRWGLSGFTVSWFLMNAGVYFLQKAQRLAVGYHPLTALLLLAFFIASRFLSWKTTTPNTNSVKQFREDYENVESHHVEYPTTMSLTHEEAQLPAITTTVAYDDAPIEPDITDEMEDLPSVYVLLGTTSMMFRPYGFNQFYHAYKQRNVVPCLITPTCEIDGAMCELNSLRRTTCVIGVEWRSAANWTREIIRATIGNLDMQVVPQKSLEWIRHFNGAAKKQRALDGVTQRNTGFIRKETNIFLKGDEVLYGRDGYMKPRTVKALHPTVQASCYKEIAECMDRLKIFFNQNQVHYIRSWQVTFSIGSGKTSSQLNTWFQESKEWVETDNFRAAMIVAGDDFFAIVRNHDEIYYLENDFSKFDRTQGVHAQDAEALILGVLGMSEHIRYLLFSTMNLQPRYENKRLDYHRIFHMPPQRATGAPDTTIGNTINNIISVIYALMRSNTFDNIAADQARLGLEAKLQRHLDPSHATFLKGWWLPCQDSYFWLPLPSQTIKMGKILTHPKQIFKHLPEDSAWRSAAKSMGCSYKNVPYHYPLFGALLQRYAELDGQSIDLSAHLANNTHKIVVDEKAEVDKYVARVYVAERYNLTYEDIVSMEAEILSMPFPGLAAHPGWASVVRKDYG